MSPSLRTLHPGIPQEGVHTSCNAATELGLWSPHSCPGGGNQGAKCSLDSTLCLVSFAWRQPPRSPSLCKKVGPGELRPETGISPEGPGQAEQPEQDSLLTSSGEEEGKWWEHLWSSLAGRKVFCAEVKPKAGPAAGSAPCTEHEGRWAPSMLCKHLLTAGQRRGVSSCFRGPGLPGPLGLSVCTPCCSWALPPKAELSLRSPADTGVA